jgi:hypothetical protein
MAAKRPNSTVGVDIRTALCPPCATLVKGMIPVSLGAQTAGHRTVQGGSLAGGLEWRIRPVDGPSELTLPAPAGGGKKRSLSE